MLLYTIGADGTSLVPSFIDSMGVTLDKDGFPVGMNFWAGLDGQVYVRGKVFATGGEFTGTVKAQDFLLPSGDTMVSILNNDKKIKSDWLDLLGINIKDAAGNTMMTIDGTNGITINKGSISWGAVTGTDEIDNRISAAQSTANSAMSAADDAQGTADDANSYLYKVVTGSALPSSFVKPSATFINGKIIKSPKIEAGSITSAEITGGTITGTDIYGGAFYDLNGKSKLVLNPSATLNNFADLVLYGGGDGATEAFKIYDNYGTISICGYGVESLQIGTLGGIRRTTPKGTWDFSNATVKGITAVFA